jgi:soluble lytic murein transglycosylase-like protein
VALQNIDTCLSGASPYSANLHNVKCNPGILRQFGVAQETRSAAAALRGAAKLSFMVAIAAGILFTWQAITLHVQKFSVRPDAMQPVATTVVRWAQNAWNAVPYLARAKPAREPAFDQELEMSASQLVNRWTPLIAAAGQRFDVPSTWIRAVVQIESGGRTMSNENQRITSRVGAMGLMQLMPDTYREMRTDYGLGSDPYNPRDNIFAGAAYLRWLYVKYGYPAMFAAYNDGPGHLEERLLRGSLLPAETRNYITRIVSELGGHAARDGEVAKFTRPNGAPVMIDLANVTSVRVPSPGEYPAGVQAVISMGRENQAVRETFGDVNQEMIARNALGQPVNRSPTKLTDLLLGDIALSRHDAARSERHADGRRDSASHHREHERRLAETDTRAVHLHQLSRHSRT